MRPTVFYDQPFTYNNFETSGSFILIGYFSYKYQIPLRTYTLLRLLDLLLRDGRLQQELELGRGCQVQRDNHA